MIRYHKSLINEQEADLIPSLHFIHLHQTIYVSSSWATMALKTVLPIQGIDVSIVCTFSSYILFSDWGERRDRALPWSVRAGWWRQLRPRPLCWAQVRPRLWPVEWSAWPAACQSVLVRHRVQSSRAQSSRYSSQWSSGAQCHQVIHGPPRVTCGCDPPSGVTVTAVVIVWLMIVSMRWIFPDNAPTQICIFWVWDSSVMCHWMPVSVMLYPKFQNPCKISLHHLNAGVRQTWFY